MAKRKISLKCRYGKNIPGDTIEVEAKKADTMIAAGQAIDSENEVSKENKEVATLKDQLKSSTEEVATLKDQLADKTPDQKDAEIKKLTTQVKSLTTQLATAKASK